MKITSESRIAAAIEAGASTLVGFFVSILSGYFIYPLFGWEATVVDVTGLTAIFTAISYVRSYAVRRLFVWFKAKGVLA